MTSEANPPAETANRRARIDFILDHWENPRNFGPLPGADAVAEAHNPQCGDALTVRLLLAGDGRVERAMFEGEGCTISVASASIMTEMLVGKTLSEVESFSIDAVLDLIGRDIASTRLACASVGLEGAKRAGKAYSDSLRVSTSDSPQ